MYKEKKSFFEENFAKLKLKFRRKITRGFVVRLIVSLRCEGSFAYEPNYNHKLQGFIYGLLRDSGFEMLHDKEGYKFFSFSNVFPIKDMAERDISKLIIASPNNALVASLKETLKNFPAHGRAANIGEMSFEVLDVKSLDVKLTRRNLKVLTGTPVIIRIPERNYEIYGIPEDERKQRYGYWRPKYSFDAFLKQLELVHEVEMSLAEKPTE